MTGAGAPGRPSRRELAARLSVLKRAVVAAAIACFAAVGTAAAAQSSAGKAQTSKSSVTQQDQGSGIAQSDYWAGSASGSSALDGGSAEAPVAGSHAS
jgi:hypothetical protein